VLLPSIVSNRLGTRKYLIRGYTHTARALACLRINRRVTATTARLATGRSGSTLAGEVSHLRDDGIEFHVAIAYAHSPQSGIAWSQLEGRTGRSQSTEQQGFFFPGSRDGRARSEIAPSYPLDGVERGE
jgi:hypothetical protein